MDKQIRKYSTMLQISAAANVAFGVWALLKTYMTFLIPSTQLEEIKASLSDPDLKLPVIMNLAGFVFVLCLLLRIHIARRARREVRGQKTGSLYLILSGLFALGSLTALLIDLYYSIMEIDPYIMTTISDVVVEFTSMYASLDLLRSAIGLRRARKIQASQPAFSSAGSSPVTHNAKPIRKEV